MALEEPQAQALQGRSAVEGAARELLRGLPASACREAWLLGADLGDWPLGEPTVIEALTTWLRLPGRRLHLLALQFDGLARRQPRFAAWRSHWVHAIDSRTVLDMDAGDVPRLLLAPPCCLQVHDGERFRAVLSQDPRTAVLAAAQIAAISQRSEPGWPVRELGL